MTTSRVDRGAGAQRARGRAGARDGAPARKGDGGKVATPPRRPTGGTAHRGPASPTLPDDVSLTVGDKSRGEIRISFYSNDDLSRVSNCCSTIQRKRRTSMRSVVGATFGRDRSVHPHDPHRAGCCPQRLTKDMRAYRRSFSTLLHILSTVFLTWLWAADAGKAGEATRPAARRSGRPPHAGPRLRPVVERGAYRGLERIRDSIGDKSAIFRPRRRRSSRRIPAVRCAGLRPRVRPRLRVPGRRRAGGAGVSEDHLRDHVGQPGGSQPRRDRVRSSSVVSGGDDRRRDDRSGPWA